MPAPTDGGSDFPFGLGAYLGGSSERSNSPESQVLKQLLPPGHVWNLEPDSLTSRLLAATADEFARVSRRANELIAETDPRTATETLPDWERVLGLPDEIVTEIPATVAGERLAITQKMIAQGGQTPAYFVSLAAACGYSVTISDQYAAQLMRIGKRIGARLFAAPWAYAWTVNVSPATGPALTTAQLEAAIRKAAPAHTVVVFNYL